jgi:hypothetical protein
MISGRAREGLVEPRTLVRGYEPVGSRPFSYSVCVKRCRHNQAALLFSVGWDTPDPPRFVCEEKAPGDPGKPDAFEIVGSGR